MDKAVVATRGRIMSAQSHTNPPSPTPAASPLPRSPLPFPFISFAKFSEPKEKTKLRATFITMKLQKIWRASNRNSMI